MVKHLASNAGDMDSIPGFGRSPGGGHGNPLLYSCQDNPMDREAWWATLRGVTELYTTEHACISKLFETRLEVERLQPCYQENHLICLMESEASWGQQIMLLQVQTLRRAPGCTCCLISNHSQRPLGTGNAFIFLSKQCIALEGFFFFLRFYFLNVLYILHLRRLKRVLGPKQMLII